MSYARRTQAKQAVMHGFYNETDSGNAVAWSNMEDTWYTPPNLPGPRETRYVDADNVDRHIIGYDPNVHDNVDWAVGGVSGRTKFVGSTGVTDPKTVDAHDFRGQMAVIRRMPDTNYGPVATSDHNSLLGLLYAMQETNYYFPNDVSQVDIIKAV